MMKDPNRLNPIKKARRRVSMRSALLLTLCACFLVTAGRIVLLMLPAAIRPLPEALLSLLAFGGGAYLGLCVLDGDQAKTLVRLALSRAQILYLSMLGVLCVCPMTLFADLWRSLFAPGVPAQAAGVAAGADAALFIVQLLKSALIAPVCEELFFRGYLLGAMGRHGRLRAVTASALCFALAHGVSIGGLFVHAMLGVLLGLLMLKTGSVFAPMLVHGCYNLTIMLISYAGLTPLFDRLSLLSCAIRLAGCAAFVAVIKKACTAQGTKKQARMLQEQKLSRKEAAYVVLALLMAALAAVLSGVTA